MTEPRCAVGIAPDPPTAAPVRTRPSMASAALGVLVVAVLGGGLAWWLLRPPVIDVIAGPAPVADAEPVGAPAWPMAFRDARHSGQAAVGGPTTGRLRWIRRLGANVTPGPVTGPDGTIYLATNAGVLHALDPATGEDLWHLEGGEPTGSDLSSSPLVLASGTIIWPAAGSLRGVSPEGVELWSIPMGAFPTSPVPGGERIYVMTMDGTLHAIALAPGGARATRAWELDLGEVSYASPALASDGTVLTTVDHALVAVRDDGAGGSERWRRDLGALSEISPAVAPDGTIVAGGNDRWIRTFSPDGEPLRRFDRELESYSSPVVTDSGEVLQGNHHGAVIAVDLAAGEHRLVVRRRVRRGNHGQGVWTSPVLDRDGNVYFGTASGHIVGFSWQGRLLFDIDAGARTTIDSYPAITADGALIVGGTDGVVRAIADDGTLPASTQAPRR